MKISNLNYGMMRDLLSAVKKPETIFVSHSASDRPIVEKILELFSDSNVKPVLMEYEKWSRDNKPNWMWIKEGIEKSSAVLVIITKGVTSHEYTQNWIAFETGIAAECKPPKPVFVLREENMDFPLPYLNYYFPYPISRMLSDMSQLESFNSTLPNKNEFAGIAIAFIYLMVVKGLITKKEMRQKIGLTTPNRIKCYGCNVEFFYLGIEKEFPCPCCSKKIHLSAI